MIFFCMNSEFLHFILPSKFVKKFLFQTLRRRASLEKIDLIQQTTYQFCIFDWFDTCFGVSICRTTVIVVSSSLPKWKYIVCKYLEKLKEKPERIHYRSLTKTAYILPAQVLCTLVCINNFFTSCHEILIIYEQQIYKARNNVIDCPYKEFGVIKLSQMKKV